MSDAFSELCDRFNSVTLRVTLKLHERARLTAFKGSMLHGWWGHALKQYSEDLFHIFFTEHQTNQPKPYVIHTCPDHKIHWKAGELFRFQLSLFGDATKVASQVIHALYQAAHLGLGEQRTPFSILSIESMTPDGVHPDLITTSLSQWLTTKPPISIPDITVMTQTPLRLKYKGKALEHLTFDLNFWIQKTLSRWLDISKYWVIDHAPLTRSIMQTKPCLPEHQVESQTQFIAWHRQSMSQKTKMPVGGLTGQWRFSGEVAEAWPILKIGEMLGLGSNTTMGFGRFHVLC
tara:strand:+ start:1665 stop:2534 length:870 start_codon:yes stop_codon:yes gene_type:complete